MAGKDGVSVGKYNYIFSIILIVRTWSPKHRKMKEYGVGDIFQTLAKKRLFAKESEELKEVVC